MIYEKKWENITNFFQKNEKNKNNDFWDQEKFGMKLTIGSKKGMEIAIILLLNKVSRSLCVQAHY
ncbi:MAG TPA: hypothetical protein PKY82_25340 [Pyrinomonadaceae bacterium]|nr:hypothetical protein [Pyrinomonadaceae bacterium]